MADKPNYYEKISLHNKTPEEAEKINKLFEDNINIANKIASKYYRTKYWDYDEALQIARMGLWKACLIWNPEKYRISTLAYNIINRDFMDYDTKQKKQPEILFHMEENCVTDDLTLGDVLEDEHSDISKNYEEDQELRELNEDIIYILDDIAQDLLIPSSIVKIVYITYVESTQDNVITMRNINFLSKNTVKYIINEFQSRLSEIL